MPVSKFGKAVRKARIDAGVTLMDMALDIEVSASFISGTETGRKKIPSELVTKIENYFSKFGIFELDLKSLADISNESIDISGLNFEQQALLAGFARTNLSEKQLEKFKDLLKDV